MSTRIFIIEDHRIVREAMTELIGQEPDMEVVGDAERGAEALEKLADVSVDLLLVDVSLPEMNGIDLIRQIRHLYPALRCLVVSGHREDLYAGQARQVGANGYLIKDEASDALIPAMRCILSGDSYFGSVRPGLAG